MGRNFYLRFEGDVRLPWCISLENFCEYVITQEDFEVLSIDLTTAENLDSTTLGILAKLGMLSRQKLGKDADLYCTDESICRLINSMGMNRIFTLCKVNCPEQPHYTDISLINSGDDAIRESVIRAHKTLMDVIPDNYNKFKDLVDSLEKQPKP